MKDNNFADYTKIILKTVLSEYKYYVTYLGIIINTSCNIYKYKDYQFPAKKKNLAISLWSSTFNNFYCGLMKKFFDKEAGI